MARRRQHSTKPARDRAHDGHAADARDWAARVAALEHVCGALEQALETQGKRIAAIQAHLDHLAAKISGR